MVLQMAPELWCLKISTFEKQSCSAMEKRKRTSSSAEFSILPPAAFAFLLLEESEHLNILPADVSVSRRDPTSRGHGTRVGG